MTHQKKSSKTTKKQLDKAKMAENLRNDFINLPDEQKSLIQDFFNLHSAAIHFYSLLTEDAKAICDHYIRASQKVESI